MPPSKPTLKKAISTIQLWSIAVGLVISGEYFGWNYGWGVAGTVGMLIASLIVTVLYITFVFSFTELTTSIPNAGGPFTYSLRAMGPIGGLIAGYATLIEFLFGTPAIAYALGNYLHFLHTGINPVYSAIGFYTAFTIINMLGVKESAIFNLIITLLAITELLVFMGIVAPHFQLHNFLNESMPNGFGGVFAALPFAIWLYSGIEGVAMVAEEVKDPARTIPTGYTFGIATLVILALSVMILTGGIGDWKTLSAIDYPLPEAIGSILGRDSGFTKIFASIGLFGVLASFHSNILSYSRVIFSLARENFLPKFLAQLNERFQTPHWALVFSLVSGIICILSGKTDKLIILCALGAVIMYGMSLISLFILRKKEPNLIRPFNAPFYPYSPIISLALLAFCLVSIVYYNLELSLIFFAFMGALTLTFVLFKKNTE